MGKLNKKIKGRNEKDWEEEVHMKRNRNYIGWQKIVQEFRDM